MYLFLLQDAVWHKNDVLWGIVGGQKWYHSFIFFKIYLFIVFLLQCCDNLGLLICSLWVVFGYRTKIKLLFIFFFQTWCLLQIKIWLITTDNWQRSHTTEKRIPFYGPEKLDIQNYKSAASIMFFLFSLFEEVKHFWNEAERVEGMKVICNQEQQRSHLQEYSWILLLIISHKVLIVNAINTQSIKDL